MHGNRPSAQRGVALISALMLFAIATVVAVEMSSRLLLDVRRGGNVLAHEQALSYAHAAELWGLQLLRSKLENNAETDHLGEPWAQPMVLPEFDNVRLSLQIRDAQARFNLNNLHPAHSHPAYEEQFQRLLIRHDLDPELVYAVQDWLDPDQETRFPMGAEDDFYTAQTPAYRTGDHLMAHQSELRLVRGFDAAYPALAPYLTALPVATDINLNTATPGVLQMIDASITEALAEELIRARPPATDVPLENINELLQHIPGTGAEEGLGVRSDYFELTTVVEIGPARVVMGTLVQRTANGTMSIVRRSYGLP